jgi:molybdate/tungstate transport system substrate-binding protein
MPGGRSRWRRRAFLGAAAGLTAGCVGAAGRAEPVTVLGAGSLQAALRGLARASDHRVQTEALGSAAAARLVASGRRDPDVLALADTALFDGLAEWHARIATNALVVAYTEATPGGRRVRGADRWFEPVLAGAASLGRTDPDLDPLGYRTLFALRLAAEHYGRPGLAEAVLAPDQVYPETGLLSGFETGAVDAAVVYRSMAVDRGYPAVTLPPALNLAAPAFRERYAEQRYELPDGTVVRGDLIEYGATRRSDRPAVRAVFDRLVGGQPLAEHGFEIPGRYPSYVGAVPDDLA